MMQQRRKMMGRCNNEQYNKLLIECAFFGSLHEQKLVNTSYVSW